MFPAPFSPYSQYYEKMPGMLGPYLQSFVQPGRHNTVVPPESEPALPTLRILSLLRGPGIAARPGYPTNNYV